jgi:hypothetical protein
MVSVFINHTHHTRNDAALTGVHFTVNYRGKQAQVSILGMPPLAETEQIEAVQQVLRELGQAVLDAAQSPRSIQWHLRPNQD